MPVYLLVTEIVCNHCGEGMWGCGCGKIKTVDNGMLGADCEERDVGRGMRGKGMLGGDRGKRDVGERPWELRQ